MDDKGDDLAVHVGVVGCDEDGDDEVVVDMDLAKRCDEEVDSVTEAPSLFFCNSLRFFFSIFRFIAEGDWGCC